MATSEFWQGLESQFRALETSRDIRANWHWLVGSDGRGVWQLYARNHEAELRFKLLAGQAGAALDATGTDDGLSVWRVPESTMLALMGHMSRTMLQRYSHIRMAVERTAVDSLVLNREPASTEALREYSDGAAETLDSGQFSKRRAGFFKPSGPPVVYLGKEFVKPSNRSFDRTPTTVMPTITLQRTLRLCKTLAYLSTSSPHKNTAPG